MIHQKYLVSFLSLAILVCATKATSQPLEVLIDQSWAKQSLWEDGLAEIAVYQGEQVIYGKSRPHSLRLITVKEDFNADLYVKADWPYSPDKPIFPVLKQNQVATIETPNYPYHYMASVFFKRDNMNAGAVKLTTSSQEWCGITSKEFAIYSKVPTQTFISYWDGQGTGTVPLDFTASGTFFEEELPLLVRALNFQPGATASFNVVRNQTTSKAQQKPKVDSVVLTISEPKEPLVLPNQTVALEDYWVIDVTGGDQPPRQFQVGRDYPNPLFRYDLGGGRIYELESLERRDYWVIRNDP